MPFSAILEALVRKGGGLVRGAVFCDAEGERVEGALADPALDAFALDVAGASYAAVAGEVHRCFPGACVRLVHDEGVVWLQLLKDGYYLVVLAHRRPPAVPMARALEEASEALIAHM